MIVAAEYSFNQGREYVTAHHAVLLKEVKAAIKSIRADDHKTKRSSEKTMSGRMLYSPPSLNKAFKDFLLPKGWKNHKVSCNYSSEHYASGYEPTLTRGAFRDMDFVKNKLGVEVQFGNMPSWSIMSAPR